MLSAVLASAIYAAAMQNAAATSARSALVECLRSAAAEAMKTNVAADGLTPHMRATCSAQAAKLKSALVAFDMKNGISRKQAGADADLQLDDYYATQEDKYRYQLEKVAKTASSN